MRLLIVGCDDHARALVQRFRSARALRPLQLCVWDADVNAAMGLVKEVGGVCLREVTPAMLAQVDVVLVFDHDAAELRVNERCASRLPAVVVMNGTRAGDVTARAVYVDRYGILLSYAAACGAEHRIVCEILFRSVARVVEVEMALLPAASAFAQKHLAELQQLEARMLAAAEANGIEEVGRVLIGAELATRSTV